jgi:hypothetical protein
MDDSAVDVSARQALWDTKRVTTPPPGAQEPAELAKAKAPPPLAATTSPLGRVPTVRAQGQDSVGSIIQHLAVCCTCGSGHPNRSRHQCLECSHLVCGACRYVIPGQLRTHDQTRCVHCHEPETQQLAAGRVVNQQRKKTLMKTRHATNEASAANKASIQKLAANKSVAAKKDVTHKAAARKPAALPEDASHGDSISLQSISSEEAFEIIDHLEDCDVCLRDECVHRPFSDRSRSISSEEEFEIMDQKCFEDCDDCGGDECVHRADEGSEDCKMWHRCEDCFNKAVAQNGAETLT